ncbi:MAG: hypothetical protein GXP21_08730 [Gammaproteobacteria bacterium]|nr:hypothetical protein [Gammaproteobacteria bacterium]
MPLIKVFPFTYYDAEQGVRQDGAGMRTKEKISEMKKKDPSKDHQIIESCAIEIEMSKLNEIGLYYPPSED